MGELQQILYNGCQVKVGTFEAHPGHLETPFLWSYEPSSPETYLKQRWFLHMFYNGLDGFPALVGVGYGVARPKWLGDGLSEHERNEKIFIGGV